MFTIPELAADALGSYLAEHMGRRFGSTDPGPVSYTHLTLPTTERV